MILIFAEWFMVYASKMEKQRMSHALWKHRDLNKKSFLEDQNLWRYTCECSQSKTLYPFFLSFPQQHVLMVMRKSFWTIRLVDAFNRVTDLIETTLFALYRCSSSVLGVYLIPSIFIQLLWLDQLTIVMSVYVKCITIHFYNPN